MMTIALSLLLVFTSTACACFTHTKATTTHTAGLESNQHHSDSHLDHQLEHQLEHHVAEQKTSQHNVSDRVDASTNESKAHDTCLQPSCDGQCGPTLATKPEREIEKKPSESVLENDAYNAMSRDWLNRIARRTDAISIPRDPVLSLASATPISRKDVLIE